jgi:hypothetical protein
MPPVQRSRRPWLQPRQFLRGRWQTAAFACWSHVQSIAAASGIAAIAVVVTVPPRQALGDELVAELRVVDGAGDVDAMRLGIVAAGARWRVAPTLDVHAVALGLATAGAAELGEPAAGGAGGEVGVRVLPWPSGRLRPHLAASLGVLAFPGTPFLPGGDVYEGIITFGAGVDLALTPRWTVGVAAFSVHLSNGQGLGAHNPAYDGTGASLTLAYVHAAPPPVVAALPPARTSPDVVVEAAAGSIDDALFVGGRVRAALDVAPWATAQLDVEAGSLDEHAVAEVGADVVGRVAWLAAGAHAGYRRYAGLDIAVLAGQLEARLTAEVVAVASVHHERGDAGPLWRAGAGLRVAPAPTITVDLGVGWNRIGDDAVFGGDHSDPYLGAEWRTPWRLADRHLAVFVERQIATLDVVGVRLTGAAPRWRRLR